jgi:hypothetical protein
MKVLLLAGVVSVVFHAHAYQSVTQAPNLKGEYSVPVPPELEPYASYPLDDVCWYSDGKTLSLGYTLPDELTGSKNPIVLTGEDTGQATFKLAGDHGDADCSRGDSMSVSCRISYRKLNFDVDSVKQILSSEFPDPVQLTQRSAVSAVFRSDPIGVITFPDLVSAMP